MALSVRRVDRLGVSVEFVNHLLGGSTADPRVSADLLAIGRTGSGVIDVNAARYLEVL